MADGRGPTGTARAQRGACDVRGVDVHERGGGAPLARTKRARAHCQPSACKNKQELPATHPERAGCGWPAQTRLVEAESLSNGPTPIGRYTRQDSGHRREGRRSKPRRCRADHTKALSGTPTLTRSERVGSRRGTRARQPASATVVGAVLLDIVAVVAAVVGRGMRGGRACLERPGVASCTPEAGANRTDGHGVVTRDDD